MSRTAIKETVLPMEDGTELLVPKDMNVMLCAYALHRREKYWRDPCSFDPERFLSKDHTPFSYFPFSLGPRMCMGHKFAQIESLIAIVTILCHSVHTKHFISKAHNLYI